MAGYFLTKRVVQPGVGLVAEAVAHRKAKKSDKEVLKDAIATGQDPSEIADKDSNDNAVDSQAAIETFEQTKLSEPAKYVVPKGNILGPAPIKTLVNSYVAEYPPNHTSVTLQSPVIIPQRRPGDKSRGFLHAYAPLLRDVGISQNAWLDFLATFEESIKISPAFDVFNMAVGVMGVVGQFVPNPFTTVATIALLFAEETAKHTYQRFRANSFFGEINEKFFMPLGLYCLIMTYDPYARAASETFDMSGEIEKAHGQKTARAYLKRNMGGVKGKTRGEAMMPSAAELVYPEEDGPGDEKKANRFVRSKNFVDEYLDKRANSRFATNNPSSILAHEPEFESSMGSIGTKRQHSDRRGGPIGAPLSHVVEAVSGGKYQGRAANPLIMASRAIKSKALYLMVTPLPTKDEMKKVREYLEVKEMSENEAAEYERREEEEDRREEVEKEEEDNKRKG